ncbi:MAG: DNA translocase FtsK 4TM domain-containing protein, partial [Betaproteobacteria bacterium]
MSDADGGLSPRFARLVRESWWLLVVAAFAFLALTLATYATDDPGWSTTGTGGDVRNAGGPVGAWLSDLLRYLFGLSTWWLVIGGVVLIVAGLRRVVRPDEESDHPLLLGVIGFALVLLTSAALESIRLWTLTVKPFAAGGVLGDAIGQGTARALGFNGATLLLLVLLAVGLSLLFGISWLKVMERIGAGVESLISTVRRRREEAFDRRIGEEALAEREHIVEQLREVDVEREPVVVVPPVIHVPKSERVVKERQRPLFTDMPDSRLPPLALLEEAPPTQESVSNETLDYTSRLIERKLADFGVSAKVLAAYPGPVITRYEIEPAVGVKGAQIVNLIKDLARALSVVSIRLVETIPGKSCMGLELPNPRRQMVKLVEILSSATYNDTSGALTLALGKDIAGKPIVADLARMPHLLVAGTTGSGKSVAVNAMILSLLYKAEPKDVRLIL